MRILSTLFLFFSILGLTSAQVIDPVHWAFESEKISEGEYKLIFKADIDNGWSVYSQFIEEGGPEPTTIVYDTPEDIEWLGVSSESGKRKAGFDPVFEMDVVKFYPGQPYTISQPVKVRDITKPLSGYILYMACEDGSCRMLDEEFVFQLNEDGGAHTGKMKIEGEVIDQKITSIVETRQKPLGECGDEMDEDSGLFWTFFIGMLGGFAALLTPCVFPMIPITVSYFTKDTKRKGWITGLQYGLSIILIYVALGLSLSVFIGPQVLNELATNWIANLIFFAIFMFFAFSFFGFYELTLPSSWSTKTDKMADSNGLLGIFFMAATLAIVSFSCTGPLIGSALVSAANKGEYLGPLLTMLGFSTALALPFGLFAAFPVWLNAIPRSGNWMNNVKVVLGFLEVAFAFKFLSTADLTQGWGILKYEAFLIIWIAIALLVALYLFGYIRFPHDSPVRRRNKLQKGIAFSFLLMAAYLASGFMINENTGVYKSSWLMSGLAPPGNYNLFLKKEAVDARIKAKYPSFTKCANNIDCFKDYYEGMSYANEVGKPVFLDFTGHGCQNCRRTEDLIWVDPLIRQKLQEELVLISLYVDERKSLDRIFVSAHDGEKLRDVGKKWMDFEEVNFESNALPLYIMVTPDEQVITRPRGFKESAKDYYNYLECGLNAFGTLN